MESNSQRKIGVIISYLNQAVKMLTGLLYTPIMLKLLGQSEYGLYQLVYSVVSYLSLLSLGFGASYMRFYSRERAQNNEDGVAKINGMFLLIFSVISLICMFCGLIMLAKIEGVFGTGLTKNEYATAKVLLMLMIINLSLTFYNSVFDCIVASQERFLFQNLLLFVKNILNPVVTLPLLFLGYGSVGMVIVSTALTVGGLVFNAYYCLVKLKVRFIFRNLHFSLLKEMWIFTFFIFLNQIVNQINWSVDKFLLGRLAGITSVAVYGVSAQINTLYLQFSTSVSNVFVPTVNRIVAESNDNDELTKLFTKVGRVQFIIMSLILTEFFFFGRPFIYYWAGEEYSISYFTTLLLIVPVTVPLIQNLGIEIQRAKNKHKARSVVYFFIAIINIFMSIPLIKVWGPVGAALGTALSLFAGNILFMNWYYNKKLGIDIWYFWKNIASFIPGLILPYAIGCVCMIFVNWSSILGLMIGMASYSLIYMISMYFLGMNTEEKSIVKYYTRRVVKRN